MAIADRIDDKVLEYIRSHGPSKAKQIADVFGVDRSLVNQALYGSLRGRVKQTKDYKWFLADARRKAETQSAGTATNSRVKIFQYYVDCLSEDEDCGVRVFADSRYDLDYAELAEWPFDADHNVFEAEAIRKLVGRQRREARKKALWLGYPVLLRRARSRNGWEGSFLEPLLLWPQDTDSGDLAFHAEPLINSRALSALVASESVLDEAAHLAEELGLDSAESPPLDEMIARLRDLRPEWEWKDPLVPAPFRKCGELRAVDQTGMGL